ncbi:MAG: glycosyltransferase [Candidatus Omnitrophota bacterium]
MKILCVGYHNPNFVNTTVYREKAVRDLGHKTVEFDDRGFFLPGRLRDRFVFFQEWDLNRLNKRLMNCVDAETPDICLIVGGHHILPDTVRYINGKNIITVLWTTDSPWYFDNVLKAAPAYKHIFCAGTEAIEIFEREGIKGAAWLPFACDPDYHKPAGLCASEKARYGKDVVSVGSFYPNRAEIMEKISDFDIGVWGPYWDRIGAFSPLRGKVTDVKINYSEWVKIYSAARVVLVLHYDDKKTPCYQASPKLYEAMACGAFVISDNQRDVKNLFENGKHLVIFNSVEDLREKLKFYIANEDQRAAIAMAGYKEVLEKHTYKDRIRVILDKTGIDR